jgi:hypothetical protein
MTDHRYLSASDVDTLAALVMELAAQLHVERQRRLALEQALAARGIVDIDALERAASDPAVAERGRAALDGSIRALLRIMTERGDPQTPLRGEAVGQPP